MNAEQLKNDLQHDEGRRSHAYPDPLTKNAPWTIGVGHTGNGIGPDTVWTDAQIDRAYDLDVAHAVRDLQVLLPVFNKLDDVRQNVLINMCFNMGINRLLQFHHMIDNLRIGAYQLAAEEMLSSRWAQQVGDRAQRLAKEMRTGEFQNGN